MYYIYNIINQKQTIRTLGSIENKQPKQPKQPKKSTKVTENESDDNIEVNSEPEEEEYIEPEPVIKPMKKRNISDEQKKF